MKLVTYQSEQGPRVAGVRGNTLVDLNQADGNVPSCIKALLAQGAEGLRQAKAAMESGTAMESSSVRLLPPIPSPAKIICIGVNYAEHAKEGGLEPPTEPVVFSKLTSTVRADGETIVLPPLSQQVDYEAELVVIIGSGGRHISEERAMEHIAGYCCGNDVSARDWQFRPPAKQWLLGKSFDTFAPFGPAIITADEVPDPDNLDIQLRLNGEVMQKSNTSSMIFSVRKLISFISDICTLLPGDVIFTGTPPGVGFARDPQVFLKPGDQMEVEIETIGLLRNPVVAEE